MRIRPAAVAGFFYPADEGELRADVDRLLAAVDTVATSHPKALIVPHAGYIYSGPTAACAYALLRGADIQRVVMFGPAHRLPFAGIALPETDAFATPLGVVPLDGALLRQASREPGVLMLDAAHVMEHALEVQLPFLQRVLGTFMLAPMVIGQADEAMVAQVIDALWGDARTLIVISSDLSHYHADIHARRLDKQTIDRILALNGPLTPQQACGATGINGLLRVARRRGLTPQLLDYRTSGDTAGDRSQVVGYTSIAFREAACAANKAAS